MPDRACKTAQKYPKSTTESFLQVSSKKASSEKSFAFLTAERSGVAYVLTRDKDEMASYN